MCIVYNRPPIEPAHAFSEALWHPLTYSLYLRTARSKQIISTRQRRNQAKPSTPHPSGPPSSSFVSSSLSALHLFLQIAHLASPLDHCYPESPHQWPLLIVLAAPPSDLALSWRCFHSATRVPRELTLSTVPFCSEWRACNRVEGHGRLLRSRGCWSRGFGRGRRSGGRVCC